MKIAIMLAGLLIDKIDTLPHIKQMFDYIATRNNIEIDYYCHFWAPENMYPYNIDYNSTNIVVPWENMGSINYAMDVFKPVDFKISNYTDMLPYFNAYSNEFSKKHVWLKDVFSNSDSFINKDIHRRFFVDNFNNPVYDFDKWWAYHIKWCQFVHQMSQIYSTSQTMKLVANSGVDYDAVIRWRYDVLFDYKGFESLIVDTCRNIKHDKAFYTELAWEGLSWTSDLPFDINSNTDNKIISLHDGWWITNNEVNTQLANQYIDICLENMIDTIDEFTGGMHTWHYTAIVKSNLPIRLTGRIKHTIVRFPDKIPHDWHDDPGGYYTYMWNTYHVFKPDSDFKNSLQYWDEKSKYYTIRYFDFY